MWYDVTWHGTARTIGRKLDYMLYIYIYMKVFDISRASDAAFNVSMTNVAKFWQVWRRGCISGCCCYYHCRTIERQPKLWCRCVSIFVFVAATSNERRRKKRKNIWKKQFYSLSLNAKDQTADITTALQNWLIIIMPIIMQPIKQSLPSVHLVHSLVSFTFVTIINMVIGMIIEQYLFKVEARCQSKISVRESCGMLKICQLAMIIMITISCHLFFLYSFSLLSFHSSLYFSLSLSL